jgi:hypothetical protein
MGWCHSRRSLFIKKQEKDWSKRSAHPKIPEQVSSSFSPGVPLVSGPQNWATSPGCFMGTWSMVPGLECFRRFVSFRCRAYAATVEAALENRLVKHGNGSIHENPASVDVLFELLEGDG